MPRHPRIHAEQPDGPFPPRPPMRWDFPAPPYEALVEALNGDRELAYAAMLSLRNCPPEIRILAALVLHTRAEIAGGELPERAAP